MAGFLDSAPPQSLQGATQLTAGRSSGKGWSRPLLPNDHADLAAAGQAQRDAARARRGGRPICRALTSQGNKISPPRHLPADISSQRQSFAGLILMKHLRLSEFIGSDYHPTLTCHPSNCAQQPSGSESGSTTHMPLRPSAARTSLAFHSAVNAQTEAGSLLHPSGPSTATVNSEPSRAGLQSSFSGPFSGIN